MVFDECKITEIWIDGKKKKKKKGEEECRIQEENPKVWIYLSGLQSLISDLYLSICLNFLYLNFPFCLPFYLSRLAKEAFKYGTN